MHELSLTRSIIALCTEHAEGRQVERVTLELGLLSCVLPDALKFCFEACQTGTLLENAELDIVRIPGRARCRRCGSTCELKLVGAVCECGSRELEPLSGEEVKVRSIELGEQDKAGRTGI